MLRAALYRDGPAAARDQVLLAAARGGADHAATASALAEIGSWHAPAFPLAGADILARGMAPGPALGRLLDEVETWWMARDFAPDRASCLARLDELMARSPPAAGS
jgi:poly(A) polymerase